MAGVVEDEFNALVAALSKSEYTKDESILILKEYVNVLFQNNLESNQRYGVSMTTSDFIKRVNKHDWKFAHGFFGNWAKSVVKDDLDNVAEGTTRSHVIEDQDVGC